MLSITASVATMLDGDAFKTIRTRADENTPQYKQIDRLLRNTRNANRRKDAHMERVFTVRRAEQDPNLLLFVVDPEESLKNAGHAGEVYRGGSGLNIDQPTVETNYITDEFGSWLRSYAPIHDSKGTIVGGVVVEAPVDWVQGRMWPIAVGTGCGAWNHSYGRILSQPPGEPPPGAIACRCGIHRPRQLRDSLG